MPVTPIVSTAFYLGLDVGQVRDPASLCVLERRSVFTPGGHHPADPTIGAESLSYRIRHLERLKLGTTYPDVVARVAAVVDRLVTLESRPGLVAGAEVIVDVTGVGRPVYDLLRDVVRGAMAIGVHFTAGKGANNDGRIWNLPKRDLVAGLVVGFQARELLVADKLAEAAVLVDQLVNFQQTISAAGHDSYANDAKRVKNDDYVTAAGLSYWRAKVRAPRVLGSGSQSLL